MEVLEVLSDTPPSGPPSATGYLDIHCSVHTQYELKTFPINSLSLPGGARTAPQLASSAVLPGEMPESLAIPQTTTHCLSHHRVNTQRG